jgi:hypothetical protein
VNTYSFWAASADTIGMFTEEARLSFIRDQGRPATPVGATEELRARNRQRSALAVVSQNAINAEDLTALLNEAAAVAADTLAAEHSAILQILPDGDELVLRAGVGWNAGPAGPHRVPATVGSAYGFVLHADAPIVVTPYRPSPVSSNASTPKKPASVAKRLYEAVLGLAAALPPVKRQRAAGSLRGEANVF